MRYFKNNYKKMLMTTLFLTVVGLIIYVLPIFIESYKNYFSLSFNVSSLFTYALIISVFVGIFEFSIFKKRSGADFLYSLPESIKKVKLIHYVKGIIELFVSFTIVFLFGIIAILSKGLTDTIIYFLPMYFILLLGIIALYSFVVFYYSKANNIVDGLVIMALFMLLMYVIPGTIDSLVDNINLQYDAFLPTSPVISFQNYFADKISKKEVHLLYYEYIKIERILSYIIWILVSFFAVSYYIFLDNQRSENIGSISNSYFGYKTLIPLLQFLIVLLMDNTFKYSYDFIQVIVMMLVGYIGYIIYERTFKVKWYHATIVVVVPLLASLIQIIINYYRF